MAVKADLHIHSTVSDGSMYPEEIVAAAKDLELSAIAITDHDTIDGIEPAVKAARNTGVEVINGVEITVMYENREVHTLAYAFDSENTKLKECLCDHKKARIKRAKAIVENLQAKGLELSLDEVLAEAMAANVGRPHIARALVAKGYVATEKEAFIRYLSDEALGVLKNRYHALEDVITIIKQANGVLIIAHPGRFFDDRQLNEFVEAGIDGLETVHPSHSFEMQKHLESFTEANHLLATGGSDYHGKRKNYYRHFGTLGVNMQCIKQIKWLADQRKKIMT